MTVIANDECKTRRGSRGRGERTRDDGGLRRVNKLLQHEGKTRKVRAAVRYFKVYPVRIIKEEIYDKMFF